MRKIIFLTLIVVSGIPFKGRGQGQAREEIAVKAIGILHKLATKYQQAQYLGFDVLYRYAAEGTPGTYLDTLRGQYKLQGSRFWSILDNRVSICDDHLMLIVFNEDSLIYLVRPPVASTTQGQGGSANPMAIPDSLLLRDKNTGYQYETTPAEELVSMTFKENVPCKKITWHIDRKTGYLTKVISIMRSDQLYDPTVRPLVTDAATSWVIVETLYDNYRQGAFDDSVFDLGKYIKKEGQEYVTVAPYESYKVFLGSSGL
jgi:hypothetical protein